MNWLCEMEGINGQDTYREGFRYFNFGGSNQLLGRNTLTSKIVPILYCMYILSVLQSCFADPSPISPFFSVGWCVLSSPSSLAACLDGVYAFRASAAAHTLPASAFTMSTWPGWIYFEVMVWRMLGEEQRPSSACLDPGDPQSCARPQENSEEPHHQAVAETRLSQNHPQIQLK